eukprot:1388641-Pyramimonas_sp.AAC.1
MSLTDRILRRAARRARGDLRPHALTPLLDFALELAAHVCQPRSDPPASAAKTPTLPDPPASAPSACGKRHA